MPTTLPGAFVTPRSTEVTATQTDGLRREAEFSSARGPSASPSTDSAFGLTRLPNELVVRMLESTDPLALYGVARVSSRLRRLCQDPSVRTAVLPPARQATGPGQDVRGPAPVPSWMQVVSKARLALFAQGVAAGRSSRLALTNAHEEVELSVDQRWVLASGAEGGAKLFDLARNGKQLDIFASEGCLSPNGRFLCAFEPEAEFAYLYDLESLTLEPHPVQTPSDQATWRRFHFSDGSQWRVRRQREDEHFDLESLALALEPHLVQTPSDQATWRRFHFSDGGQWLVQRQPEGEHLFATAAVFQQRSISSAIAEAEEFCFGDGGRFALGCAGRYGEGDATLYDALCPSTALTVTGPGLDPSHWRTRRVSLFDAWLLAEVTNRVSIAEATYISRADERPLRWHEVAGLWTQHSGYDWFFTKTLWPDRVLATRHNEVPLLLDLTLGELAAAGGCQFPEWLIDGVVPYACHQPEFHEAARQVDFILPSFSLPIDWRAVYGGDPLQGLRLRSFFPSLRGERHHDHTEGSLDLFGCIGRDRVMLTQRIYSTSGGLPVPFVGPGDPEECRLLIAPADAPESPTHVFVHSKQPNSAALWSDSLRLLVQTLGAYDNRIWRGTQRPQQSFLRQLPFDSAGVETSVELLAGWRFVEFLEAARGVLLRDADGALRVVSLCNLEDPFVELRTRDGAMAGSDG